MLGCMCMGVGEVAAVVCASGGIGMLAAYRASAAAWWSDLFGHRDGGDAQLAASTRRSAVVALVLLSAFVAAAFAH